MIESCKLSLLSDHYDAVLPSRRKQRLGIVGKVCFISNLGQKHFLLISAQLDAYSIKFGIILCMYLSFQNVSVIGVRRFDEDCF
jgi:hypothetical protein